MPLQEQFEIQGNRLFRYRGIIPILFLAAGIGAYLQTLLSKSGIQDPFAFEAFRFVCLFISLTGLAVRVYTVAHTPENTSGRNTSGQLADQLNTTGIYSVVRHPLYLGNFFMWFGVTLLTQNWWFMLAFVFLYMVYYERIMLAEEQFLRSRFREKYLEWAQRTPAVVPDFKNRVKPALPFSWKKAVKKEKNSVFYVFLVFFLFQCIDNLIKSDPVISYNWLFYAAVSSAVIYFILKAVKRLTTWLDEPGR
jgi:protein-S-isoprenylcysteine O-methyltransferase Ste14